MARSAGRLRKAKTNRQIGSPKSRIADKKRKALHPGTRVSKSGNTYSERRANRSDVDRRKKL